MRRPTREPAAEERAPDTCVACRRTGTTLATTELADGTLAKTCADPGDCNGYSRKAGIYCHA